MSNGFDGAVRAEQREGIHAARRARDRVPNLRQRFADGPGGRRIGLDELHCSSAPRQCFEPKGPAPGEEVQATPAGQFELQPVEQGFADPVRGRAQRFRLREMQLPSAPFAADDPDFATPSAGGSRALAGDRLRSGCCVGNTAFAAGPRTVVARHRRASVGFGGESISTRDVTRGHN